MERPKSVTIMAILLAAFGGAFQAVVGIGLLGLGLGLGFGLGAIILGVIVLADAVLYLVFAFGAWSLKPWAWTLGIVTQVIALIGPVLSLFQGSIDESQIGSVVAPAIILYYLFKPDVKKAFGRA